MDAGKNAERGPRQEEDEPGPTIIVGHVLGAHLQHQSYEEHGATNAHVNNAHSLLPEEEERKAQLSSSNDL